jgi:hypothetical protein
MMNDGEFKEDLRKLKSESIERLKDGDGGVGKQQRD